MIELHLALWHEAPLQNKDGGGTGGMWILEKICWGASENFHFGEGIVLWANQFF